MVKNYKKLKSTLTITNATTRKEQIEKIRLSCQLAANTLQHVKSIIKEGMSSEELDNIIFEYIKDHNATPATLGYMDFPKSSCISFNETVCHGIPDKRVFKNGDIIKVDVATILNGFYGDTCATFPIGDISKEAKKLINVARTCLDVGIMQVVPNAPINSIGQAITVYAQLHNCSVVFEYGGHGVGVKFHEPPHILHVPNPCIEKMKPGMIFTIEPMINLGSPKTVLENDGWTVNTIDKKLSAQFEHTILVTDNGHEILTVPTK